MIIKRLVECSDSVYDELSALDDEMVCLYGKTFSEESWGADNFKYSLPSKDVLSKLIFSGGKLEGYCIASLKQNFPYVHRFVVKKQRAKNGVSHSLLTSFLNECEADVFLSVNSMNDTAICFYKQHGFEIETKHEILLKLNIIDENIIFDITQKALNFKFLMKKTIHEKGSL